jgi:L-rhamnose-H+ transport protein
VHGLNTALSGALLVIVGGVFMGSFTVPMKFTRHWAWENTWLIYAIVGLACIPLALALATVPHLITVYEAAEPKAVDLAVLFGMGWGVGSVLLGIGVDKLGVSLGFGIIIGLTAALGSLVPLVVQVPEAFVTMRGIAVLAGLGIVICGIVLCARAGSIKSDSAHRQKHARYGTGLLICIGAGVFSSMLNLAFAFGAPVAEVAIANGATRSAAQNAIWALAAGAGSLPNMAYTLLLLSRNKTWNRFRAAGSHRSLLLATAMGILWMAGILIYGAGAAVLGNWGPIIGWPLFMSMIIITGNLWGQLTREWKHAPLAAVRLNWAGVAMLIAAIIVIGFGGAA